MLVIFVTQYADGILIKRNPKPVQFPIVSYMPYHFHNETFDYYHWADSGKMMHEQIFHSTAYRKAADGEWVEWQSEYAARNDTVVNNSTLLFTDATFKSEKEAVKAAILSLPNGKKRYKSYRAYCRQLEYENEMHGTTEYSRTAYLSCRISAIMIVIAIIAYIIIFLIQYFK